MWSLLLYLFNWIMSFAALQNHETQVDLGYFWHVSDFHYDDSYGNASQSCYLPVSDPGPYGNEACDSPWRLVEDSIKAMANIKPDVDFILWTGDNAAHIPTPEFSMKRNLAMIHHVTTAMKRLFPDVAAVPAFGNHDFFPADYTNGTEREFYATVCQMWSSWIQDPEQLQSCRKGGFYSRLINDKLRVLAVNTVLYLTKNPKSKNLTDPARQFEWLEATLKAAMDAGEKVIVSAHVPPTIPAPSMFNWFYPQYQGRYVELMAKFSEVIIAHHYGHEHLDTFKILQREDESGASPVFLAPSVTPQTGIFGPGKFGPRHNPGVRLVEYDRQTGKHLGYRQFYTNITDDNSQGRADWEQLYSFQEAYDVPDMGVHSLRNILHKMAKPYSGTMLQYCTFYAVTKTRERQCTLEQQAKFWCAAQLTEVDKTKECVKHYMHHFQKKSRRWFCSIPGVACKKTNSTSTNTKANSRTAKLFPYYKDERIGIN